MAAEASPVIAHDKHYVLCITTHGSYPVNIKDVTRTRSGKTIKRTFKFEIEESPIKFCHVSAAPPGICNFMPTTQLDRILPAIENVSEMIKHSQYNFLAENPKFISGLLQIYLQKMVDTYKTQNNVTNVKFSSNVTRSGFFSSLDKRFEHYGEIKKYDKFIDKYYGLDSNEHVNPRVEGDFNIQLFEIGDVDENIYKSKSLTYTGIKRIDSININDFIKERMKNHHMTRDKSFGFYLSDILSVIKRAGIENLSIIDFGCSSYMFNDNSHNEESSIQEITKAFNEFYDKHYSTRKRQHSQNNNKEENEPVTNINSMSNNENESSETPINSKQVKRSKKRKTSKEPRSKTSKRQRSRTSKSQQKSKSKTRKYQSKNNKKRKNTKKYS